MKISEIRQTFVHGTDSKKNKMMYFHLFFTIITTNTHLTQPQTHVWVVTPRQDGGIVDAYVPLNSEARATYSHHEPDLASSTREGSFASQTPNICVSLSQGITLYTAGFYNSVE